MPVDRNLSSSSIDALSPTLRKQAQAYVDARANSGVDDRNFDVSGARAALQKSSNGRFEGGAFNKAFVGHVPVYQYEANGGHLIYLHGGGFVGGTVETHGNIALYLARQTGCSLAFPEYRLAPEHRFPAAFEDVDDVLATVDRPVVLAGDSVGGALAIHLALRHPNRSRIRAVAIMAPMLAFSETTSDYMQTHGRARQMIAHSLSASDALDPRLSPISSDLSGLPPTLIQVGGADYARSDGVKLAHKAIEDGAAVSLEHWPHMPHVWQRFAPDAPEAARSLNRVADFLSAHSIDNDASTDT